MLSGYAWDLVPLTELVSTSLLLTMLLQLVLTKLHLRQGHTSVTFLLVLVTLLSISRYIGGYNVECEYLVISRQHVVQWRRLHPQLFSWRPDPGYNTQATLYHRQRLLQLLTKGTVEPRNLSF